MTSPTRARDAERRRRHEQLLLDVGALARREVAPLVAVVDRDVHARDALHLAGLVDDALRPGLLVGLRNGARVLQHRRDVVLDVRRRRRELDVALLRDRARARDFRRDARDADEFRLRSRSGCSQIPRRRCESRARRSRRPDARHPSECRRRGHRRRRHHRRIHRRRHDHRHHRVRHRHRRPPPPPPAPAPPPPPPAAAVVKFADPPGMLGVHREAHVGVACSPAASLRRARCRPGP